MQNIIAPLGPSLYRSITSSRVINSLMSTAAVYGRFWNGGMEHRRKAKMFVIQEILRPRKRGTNGDIRAGMREPQRNESACMQWATRDEERKACALTPFLSFTSFAGSRLTTAALRPIASMNCDMPLCRVSQQKWGDK